MKFQVAQRLSGPATGEVLDYDGLYKALGCSFVCVDRVQYGGKPRDRWVAYDEFGVSKGRPYNPLASELLGRDIHGPSLVGVRLPDED